MKNKYKINHITENDSNLYGILETNLNFNNGDLKNIKIKLINKFTDFAEEEYDKVELNYMFGDQYILEWIENDKHIGLSFTKVKNNYSFEFVNPREKVYYSI